MRQIRAGVTAWLVALAALFNPLDARPSSAPPPPDPPPLTISRAAGRIEVDGKLDDEGWRGASRVETWYEVNPGDNTPPLVRSVGYLAYDDRYFYAGLELEDPDPSRIRAPLGDHDNLGGGDFAGVILDTRNDKRTGILFLVNPRGTQYDAVSDDTTNNEDSSPDFYWDSAARVTSSGWTLEIRIPFSSLRYPRTDPQTWGIMLYRNYPRAYRYQMFSSRLPRDSNCFICNSGQLQGLSRLPAGGNLVLAPYASGSRSWEPVDGVGTPLAQDPLGGDVGLDLKWTPSAASAIDATLNPDFSQIESDVAQISANERFALFYPEKRPFFLEGVELFTTPLQAVYTRTITSPRVGARATGKLGGAAYTALVADDRGGGSVILPGPNGSDVADQDFRSWVGIARVRRDVGRSYVSVLGSAREIEGGGYNRVLGPDFQWRPGPSDSVTGQLLYSWSESPNRPDLADAWNGSRLQGHAADLWWNRGTRTYDWWAEYKDMGDGFRADNGFVPQVGFRQTFLDTGYTLRPKGLVTRLRSYLIADRSTDTDGELLSRQYSPGIGLDARWGSFVRVRWAWDRVRAGEGVATLPRSHLLFNASTQPSRWLSQVSLDGSLGGEIDFDNARTGRGGSVNLGVTLRPTDHLELKINEGRRWLDADVPGAESRPRLFTARVDRLRATYNFTARLFLRGIAQYVATERDPALYVDEVEAKEAGLSGSALFAYKLNWQTVLFVGYGDTRELDEQDQLRPSDRQVFVKVSYAFQR